MKHLKNAGTIRHCEPPHALILHCHSPGVATIARRLRASMSTTTTTTTTTTRDRGDRYGPIEWAESPRHIDYDASNLARLGLNPENAGETVGGLPQSQGMQAI